MASNVGLQQILSFSHIDKHTQEHLKNVYATLAVSMCVAAAGAYVHMFTGFIQHGFLTAIASIGLLLWLGTTRHSKDAVPKRLAIMSGFAFLTGVSLGPLLDYVIHLEPSLITTALLGSSVIFVCFSLASLLSLKRYWIYLAGVLGSAMTLLLCMSLANLFIGSRLIYQAELYLGLLVFSAFIVYDTQLIVEKVKLGDRDFIWHSVDLFIDFIAVFRRLLIILAQKEEGKRRRKD